VSQFGITLKRTHQDVWIAVADNARLRVLPKPEYDDKGMPKRFKPDPNDPDRKYGGVKGSIEDLKPEEWVVVNLKRNRKATKFLGNIIIVLGQEEKK
jgi:hypothetical protein